FFRWAYDSAAVVGLLPPGSLPYAAEWQVLLVALAAGVFLREVTLPFWRRGLLSLGLVVVSLLPVIRMVAGAAPPSEEKWSGEVCRQTHPATCSAAAAATLLRQHRFTASEREMIELCFTRKDGTSLGGLMRGLAVKVRDSEMQVKTAALKPEDLKQRKTYPLILSMNLRQEVADRELRYENQWGWAVGQSHAVVLFGFTPEGEPIIGDPSVGKEVWSSKGLEELWTGAAVWLVEKEG
ncbi:MAG: cysteine peptidase family C39 domain-containing protein, partial [Verrucomicrobiota bacterium]